MKSIRKNQLFSLNDLDDEQFRLIPGIRHAARQTKQSRVRKYRKTKEV